MKKVGAFSSLLFSSRELFFPLWFYTGSFEADPSVR
jgi:hypothetical protein